MACWLLACWLLACGMVLWAVVVRCYGDGEKCPGDLYTYMFDNGSTGCGHAVAVAVVALMMLVIVLSSCWLCPAMQIVM